MSEASRAVPRDPYEVLGISRDAGDAEIKKAFRTLARELHPDVNQHDPKAEEKFKEAAEAYEILSDHERRRTYDAFGHEGLRGGGWAPNSQGGIDDILSALFGQGDSPFGDLFGGGRRAGPASGADVGVSVEVTLDEVVTGVERELTFDSVAPCEHCRGNGAEPGTPIHTCEQCGGAGQLQQMRRTAFGQLVQTSICPTCSGAGKVPEQPCEQCGGAGRERRERTWDVQIPAGIDSGQRIRIAGAGHAGEPGGRAGDLYVEVEVAPDERFERRGDDLLSVLRVPATLAMVGGKVSVSTLDGEREIKLGGGTQPGHTERLKGLGLPSLRNGRRGSQYVVVEVEIPKKLSRSQRDLAQRLHESLGNG